MGRSMTAAGRLAFGELADSGTSPTGGEQFKLDRLRELRAVIDSLRTGPGDELMTNVHASQERSLTL